MGFQSGFYISSMFPQSQIKMNMHMVWNGIYLVHLFKK